MTERATISVVPSRVFKNKYIIEIGGLAYEEKGTTVYFGTESEANSKADSLATESKAKRQMDYTVQNVKFIDAECPTCKRPKLMDFTTEFRCICGFSNKFGASTPAQAQAKQLEPIARRIVNQVLNFSPVEARCYCAENKSVTICSYCQKIGFVFNQLVNMAALTQPQAVAPEPPQEWLCPYCGRGDNLTSTHGPDICAPAAVAPPEGREPRDCLFATVWKMSGSDYNWDVRLNDHLIIYSTGSEEQAHILASAVNKQHEIFNKVLWDAAKVGWDAEKKAGA